MWRTSCRASTVAVAGLAMAVAVAVSTTLCVGALPAGAAAGHVKKPPAAPVGVVVASGNDSAVVSWSAVTPPSGETITMYRAFASASSATKHCKALRGATTCTIAKLTNGVHYTVRVRAFVGSLGGPTSAPVTIEPGLPGAPTAVRATAGNGLSTVSFTGPATKGTRVTSYNVTALDGTTPGNGGQTAEGTSSPITVTGLTDGDSYTFTVVAFDKYGPGPASVPSLPVVPVPLELSATGSAFAAVAMQQWVGQDSALSNFLVNWQVTSSVIGLNDFALNQVDFAASDLPYSADQSAGFPTQPYQYLPDVAGGLGFMYNLTGTNGQRITNLNLTPSLIGKIFLGEITRWNDPAISTANPALSTVLPNSTIIPVYHSEAGGENYLLTGYLLQLDTADFTAAQKSFQSGRRGHPNAVWPTPALGANLDATTYPGWADGDLVGENGSDSAASYVASAASQGAITYVETAYADEHSFPVASVANASGVDVQPTFLNVSTALESATFNADWSQNLGGVYTSPQASAYPLSSYSYLVTPCSPTLAAAAGVGLRRALHAVAIRSGQRRRSRPVRRLPGLCRPGERSRPRLRTTASCLSSG